MTNEQILQLGVIVVLIGFIIIISSFFFAAANEKDKEKSSVKFSVVGFLGFIPFGFGNDRRLLMFGIILTVVVVVATILLFSRNLKP